MSHSKKQIPPTGAFKWTPSNHNVTFFKIPEYPENIEVWRKSTGNLE